MDAKPGCQLDGHCLMLFVAYCMKLCLQQALVAAGTTPSPDAAKATSAATATSAAALLALAAVAREVAAHAHSYLRGGHDAWGAARAKVLPPGKPLAVFSRIAALLQVIALPPSLFFATQAVP